MNKPKVRKTRMIGDVTIVAARIREARERAGFRTPGQLWKAIQDRGGNISRQFLYSVERGHRKASLEKLTVMLEACGLSMAEFLGEDLVIVPRTMDDPEERTLIRMLAKVQEMNPSLGHVLKNAIVAAHDEVLKGTSQPKGGSS